MITAVRVKPGRGGLIQPIPHLGKMTTISDLATEYGLPRNTLYQRWHRGDRELALVRPKRERRWHVRGDSECS